MSRLLPSAIVGTTRIRPEERTTFGDFLDAAVTEKKGTLLTDGSSWLWEALRTNGRATQWEIWGQVPNVAGYVREATDYGMFGAGWRRLRRMSPLSWFRLGFQGMCNVRGVLRKDFPTLLVLLLELEMANFRRVRPRVVFLHPQITDLLLAMDHGAALEKAVRRIRKGFGAEPGLSTSNAGTLLPRLKSWGIEIPYVLTGVHPRGFGMRPNREQCEEAIGEFSGSLLATTDSSLTDDIATYWRETGVASAVYDVSSPSLKEWTSRWMTWHRAPQVNTEPAEALA